MRRHLIVLASLSMSLAACGGDEPLSTPSEIYQPGGPDTDADFGDGPETDAGQNADGDTGEDGDADTSEPPPPAPTLYHSVSGGGSVQGDGYRAVIGVGAPTGRGTTAGAGYRIQVGPVSP